MTVDSLQPKCPSCGAVDRLDVKGPGNASCLACAAAFAPLVTAFATLKSAGVDGTRLQDILVRDGAKHTACVTCADMFTTFPLLGETLHACVPCQAVWLRNGALLHLASSAEKAAHAAVSPPEHAPEGAAAPPSEPPPPPPLLASPPSKAPAPTTATASPFAALSARLMSSPIEPRSPSDAAIFAALDPPIPPADAFALDPPLPPSTASFLDAPMPSPAEAAAATTGKAPLLREDDDLQKALTAASATAAPTPPTPSAPTPPAARPKKPVTRPMGAVGTSSAGALDPQATVPRAGSPASRRKPKPAAAPPYAAESSSPSALRLLLVLVLVAGAGLAAWRFVVPSASTALGGGKGASFGKNVIPTIEPVALGTRVATRFTAAQAGGELIAWYIPAAGSDHAGSGDLLLVEILGKGVKLVGVPRRVGELTVMVADVKLGDKTGRARAFFTGKDAWILVAASTTDGFGASRTAEQFLSSLGDLR